MNFLYVNILMPKILKGNICKKIILWFLCIIVLLFSSIISTDFYNQKNLNQEILTKISNIITIKVNKIEPFYSRKLGLSGSFNSECINSNLGIQHIFLNNTNSSLNNKSDNINPISNNEWFICIPKIDLKAEINEGVTQEILNKYVGHFENTPKLSGNVCLAAHNRGYDVNYFANIKDLQINDIIFYYYNNNLYQYNVIDKLIIDETDWTRLENSESPILTLITCVEDVSNLRRCLQAKLVGLANERVDILDLDVTK